MICEFPDPYPDELIYSVCARYKDFMGYPNSVTATRDFFGDENVAAVVDLPNRLAHLIGALPPGHLYTVDEFIDKNTLFPLYTPFMSQERALLVRTAMIEEGNNHVQESLGLSADRMPKPIWLRFCPVCVERDRQMPSEVQWHPGEAYWHRTHQIQGIEVCAHHAVFLEESTVPWHNSRNPGVAISAESTVQTVSPRPLDLSEKTHKIMLDLARSAVWLLKWQGESLGGASLQNRYYNLLLRHGLAYYNGQIRASELIRKFVAFYSPEFLDVLGCKIKNPNSSWLMRLLHASKAETLQHPIRHILLLTFLGYSTEEFFTAFEEYKPFGNGPWPCLNHTSGHYRQPVVASCRIVDGVKKNLGKPVGTFRCECGFIYMRTGPDQTEEDRYSSSTVQAYGYLWEKLLKELWEDTSVTIRDIARRLGVNELTVKRRAISLGLAFPRNTPGSLRSCGVVLDRYKIVRKPPHETLEERQQELLSIIEANPLAGRTELQVIAGYLLEWLRYNDSDWLERILPPVQKNLPEPVRVDWKAEDIKLAEAVKRAALDIINLEGRPVHVSLSEIIKKVGNRAWIERDLDKLPKTDEALKECKEPFGDYLLRKIEWATDYYLKEGIVPSRNKLITRAGLFGRAAAKSERVQNAIDEALAKLST